MVRQMKGSLGPSKACINSMSKQEKYEEFLKHLPVTASDRTLMALKGHLLVEQALRDYVYNRVPKPQRLKDKQIAFSVILDFASSLDDGDSMAWVWEAAKRLNKLRNALAHNLSHIKAVQYEVEFVSYVQQRDGELSVLVNNTPLEYERLALAIFQLYDKLVSISLYSFTGFVRYSINSAALNGDAVGGPISEAMSRALRAIEGPCTKKNTGPEPRRKWPKA